MVPIAILFRVLLFFIFIAVIGIFVLRWVIPFVLGLHDKESKLYKKYCRWNEKFFKRK